MAPKKTKIICTIGPSTQGVENLVKLINAGMDAARLNFSHSTHEIHKKNIDDIHEASKLTGKPIAVLQDLQGPKIRTGKVKNGEVLIEDGAEFTITTDEIEFGDASRVSTAYMNLVNELKPGNTVLLDDGYIILSVESVNKNDINTRVVKGGILKDNKGIIAPGVSSSAPSLSEKDFEDLKFGLNAGVDAVALSFVRSERDVLELKTAMKIFGRIVPIISKIERYEGYEDIEDIIQESDAIMVARGDLGLEMPAEQVPILQKEIIDKCNYHGRPVIIATQMLESMINNPRPTRAEASDVANAVIDGADCIMLSGETSTGKYPFEAVDYMNRIIRVVENKYPLKPKMTEELRSVFDALGKASCVIAEQIKAAAIVPFTRSGYTPKNIAKYRPATQIVALTDDAHIQRRLNSFVWGVQALLIPADLPQSNAFELFSEYLKKLDYIKEGDMVVFVGGISAANFMPENMLKVYEV
jgi:pyruvate kinase